MDAAVRRGKEEDGERSRRRARSGLRRREALRDLDAPWRAWSATARSNRGGIRGEGKGALWQVKPAPRRRGEMRRTARSTECGRDQRPCAPNRQFGGPWGICSGSPDWRAARNSDRMAPPPGPAGVEAEARDEGGESRAGSPAPRPDHVVTAGRGVRIRRAPRRVLNGAGVWNPGASPTLPFQPAHGSTGAPKSKPHPVFNVAMRTCRRTAARWGSLSSHPMPRALLRRRRLPGGLRSC